MQYSELIERLNNLIGYIPSQSQLCQITGIKQSTMSSRQKDNSRFKPEEIEKLNKHFGINLYTHKNLSNYNSNPDICEILNEIYSHNPLIYNNDSIKDKLSKFGVRLSELQQKLGLSDKDFSKTIGLYEYEFKELKLGERQPNLKILLTLKIKYNISMDWIMLGD